MEYTVVALMVIGIFASWAYAEKGELNDECRVVTECRDFGYICGRNRTCQCFPKYVPNKNRDKCVGLVNQKCKYDNHCIEGAFCELQKSCKCKEGLTPDSYNYCSMTSKNTAARMMAVPALVLIVLKFYI